MGKRSTPSATPRELVDSPKALAPRCTICRTPYRLVWRSASARLRLVVIVFIVRVTSPIICSLVLWGRRGLPGTLAIRQTPRVVDLILKLRRDRHL